MGNIINPILQCIASLLDNLYHEKMPPHNHNNNGEINNNYYNSEFVILSPKKKKKQLELKMKKNLDEIESIKSEDT